VSANVLRVAVVGHTNTGKTSLLRTLTRDPGFGQVANAAGTTRHVEGVKLLIDGEALLELYDTPGLEDSMGLLDHLDQGHERRFRDWLERIQQFLDSPEAHEEFEQEAKVLRQVLACHAVLYVIDARDRILGKHQDELEILARCARPVVPVLNFVASPEALTREWREHLSRANMHAVTEFDTVVVAETGELRLFEKLKSLLDPFADLLDRLIDDLRRRRENLRLASADLIADLLLDVAAYRLVAPGASAETEQAMGLLKRTVREREQRCVDELLTLHRFRSTDVASQTFPIEEGRWGLDLFSPVSLQQFGVRASGGAAAGAAAGLAVDVLSAGITLGVATATGAALGALLFTAQQHGRRIADRLRGFSELRASDATLRLLALRQIALARALLRRGHAAQEQIHLHAPTEAGQDWIRGRLPAPLGQAKLNPRWSRLDPQSREDAADRQHARDQLAGLINAALSQGIDSGRGDNRSE